MSEKHRPPGKPQPPAPKPVYFRAPKETENKPPPVATNVRVVGGIDSITVEFFYVPLSRYSDATEGRGDDVERGEERNTLRVEPVARVVLPLSVGTELLTQMITTMMEGIPDLIRQVGLSGADILQASQRVMPEIDAVVPQMQKLFPTPAAPPPVAHGSAIDAERGSE